MRQFDKAPKNSRKNCGARVTNYLINGRGERIRTFDPLHPMQVRYQAALRPDRTWDYSLDWIPVCTGMTLPIEQLEDALEFLAQARRGDRLGNGHGLRRGNRAGLLEAVARAVDGEAML